MCGDKRCISKSRLLKMDVSYARDSTFVERVRERFLHYAKIKYDWMIEH